MKAVPNSEYKINRYAVNKLSLTTYRNLDNFKLETEGKPVVIVGANGVGKTNILEAVSLLYPGRGLKNSKFDDICPKILPLLSMTSDDSEQYTAQLAWKVDAHLDSPLGNINLNTSYNNDATTIKRNIYFNGTKITNGELASLNSIVWLTPQMDYLFNSNSTDRRKFFDRMVYSFDPDHSIRISKYEYYMRERAVVLQSKYDNRWLNLLEEKISEVAVAIAYSRLQTISALQQSINSFESVFPKAQLSLCGDLETIAQYHTALQLEELMKQRLYDNRNIDIQSKRTNFGPHRTDLLAIHPSNQNPAYLCSTGEQKALIISIILAEIYAKTQWLSASPIVLLDEVTVHLDQVRRQSLMDHLINNNVQFWLTANQLEQIGELGDICLIKMSA